MSLVKQFTIVGAAFFPLTTSGLPSEIPVHEFVQGEFTDGDMLQILNEAGSGYTTLAWYTNDAGESYWSYTRRGNATGERADDATIKPFTGVWINAINASEATPVNVTFRGRVETAVDVTKPLEKKYQLISLPVPEEIAVISPLLQWDNLIVGDMIQLPNETGTGYTILAWYTSDAGESYWSYTRRGNATGEKAVDATIKPSSAFWFVTTGENASLRFVK